MMEKSAQTFFADIHMAGDIGAAAIAIQRYVVDVGLCVTLMPQTFIYTGGCEQGFRVGLINYPRFPAEPSSIKARAVELANHLMVELGQHSYSIVTPEETTWYSRRPLRGEGGEK